MVIDLRKCTGCLACAVGCKQIHQLAVGQSWIEVFTVGPRGMFPDVSMYWLPVMCMHCQAAPCVEVCVEGAIRRRSDGIVVLDSAACQGCQACVSACPYHAIWFDQARQVATKCDLCVERVDRGELPYCVQTCTAGALHFGDLADPESDIARLIAANQVQTLLPGLDTCPSVYYIESGEV